LQPQPFDYFCILDFEATCEENKKIYPQEIIEFPTVLLNAKTLEIVDEFHQYVRPTSHPILTKFCTKLTGIQQEWVDKGNTIDVVLKDYDKWLRSHNLFKEGGRPSFAFITCGDWDLNTCLKNQCKDENIPKSTYFNSWINIKKVYASFCKTKMGDMVKMLEGLHIPLSGRHHSGIDDCRNITKIAQRILQDSAILNITGRL